MCNGLRLGPDELTLVAEIGRELDAGKSPRAWSEGVILPGASSPPSKPPGEENVYDRSEARRSESGSRKRSAGRQGAARRRGEANPAPPDFESASGAIDLESLAALRRAYPEVEVREESDAVWMLTPAKLLPGPRPRVYFVTVFPKNLYLSSAQGWLGSPMPRTWAFWPDGQWVGPRHTNSPDGSICAFEPQDGTWLPGDSLPDLMDIYSLWALRHIHLEFFGRWPGPQSNHQRYERILEAHPSEQCGCQNPKGTYAECCRDGDVRNLRLEDVFEFLKLGRRPPNEIVRFFRERRDPPSLRSK